MANSEHPENETHSTPEPAASPSSRPSAKDEIFEALGHVRSAASILIERAAKEAPIKQAATEAERVVTKIGASAEPIARQVASELSRFSKALVDAIEDKRKSEVPPPPPPSNDEK